MSRVNHICKSSELGISRIFFNGLSDKLFRIYVKVQREAIQEFFFYFKKYKTLILFKFITYLEKEIVWNKSNSRSGESSLRFFFLLKIYF